MTKILAALRRLGDAWESELIAAALLFAVIPVILSLGGREMNALSPKAMLTDLELIQAVREKADFAEAEIEAAFRFREGAAVREWHLERADTATVELLGLINGPQYRAVWDRMVDFANKPAREEICKNLAEFVRREAVA
ncbi:MAG: hypothetical protein MUE52_04215 [Tabrizicola sp.]|jgi:hypothetical protein|nr:hypothetical protein [Tabrizicola sp.]